MASAGSPGLEGSSCPATEADESWDCLGCLVSHPSEALDRNQDPPTTLPPFILCMPVTGGPDRYYILRSYCRFSRHHKEAWRAGIFLPCG